MDKVRFGKTELMVSKIALGGIPIERVSVKDAVDVVRGAINLGINFIDTANNYWDSEEKIGIAIKEFPRDSLVLSTKSDARDKKTLLEHLDLSLKRLGTDYIDIYQHHGIRDRADYDRIMGEGGAHEGMKEAITAGKVRFPAFSSHEISSAMEYMREGRFDAVQLPFNYVDDDAAKEAIPLAKELDMGFLAMKPFGGGILSDARLSIKFLSQYPSIVPDPGIEKLHEIEEIVRILNEGGEFTSDDAAAIEAAKAELGSVWCHRCGYCLPCPQGVLISMALTLEMFTRRMIFQRAEHYVGKSMEQAKACNACGECLSKCPYNLDIPGLVRKNLEIWEQLKAENNL